MLFRLFIQGLLLLLAVAFTEKALFALHHSALSDGLGKLELLRTLIWGLRFDLAVSAALALLVTLPAWLLHRVARRPLIPLMRWGSVIAGALLIGMQGADLLYFSEAGRHLGYELKEGLNSGSSLALAALHTYTLPVLLQLTLLVPLHVAGRWLFSRGNPVHIHRGFPRTLVLEAQLFAILLLAVVMIRGGVQPIPLEPLHAQEIGDNHKATLALNGGYNALFSSVTPHTITPHFATPPSRDELAFFRGLLQGNSGPLSVTPRPNANVIFVLLESWSGAYMQSYGYDQPTTPHFDRLRHQGITSQAMMTGGHRTTEGMFAIFCSLQNPLGQTVAQSHLQNYDYRCLPRLAREQGYQTAFFQGTNANTSGTGAFAQLLGFTESYGKDEMPPGQLPDNSWGRHDPDIYAFVLERLRAMPQPFMAGINTNSTHDTQLPPGKAVSFGEGAPPYLGALHFSDEALGEFVTTIRNDPRLRDSVIVLVADHPGLTPADPYRASLVPFVVLAPALSPQQLPVVLSQRDISPSVADLLGFPPQPQFTGQSVFRQIEPRFADYYYQNVVGGVGNGRVVETALGGANTACYDLADGAVVPAPATCGADDTPLIATSGAFTHVSQYRLFQGQTSSAGALQ